MASKLRLYLDAKEQDWSEKEECYSLGRLGKRPEPTFSFIVLDAFRGLENLEEFERKERIKNANANDDGIGADS